MFKARILFLAIALLGSGANAETTLNPIQLPKTNVRFLTLISPSLKMLAPFERQTALNSAFGLGMEIDIPIWKYFAAGFFLQFATANTLKNKNGYGFVVPGMDVGDSLGNSVMEFGGLARPLIEIPFFYGNLAAYTRISAGAGLAFGASQVSLFQNEADFAKQGEPGPDIRKMLYPPILGYSFPLSGSIGLEYFPAYFMGVFVEAGYQGSYLLYPLTINSRRDNFLGTSTDLGNKTIWRGFWIHGWTGSVGLKFTF
jgi:hypothetical protein